MNPRSSQPLIWTSVALCTAALYAGAYKWVRVRIPIAEPEKREMAILDLGILQAVTEPSEEPAPEIIPEPEPAPMPEPVPETIPEPPPPPPKVVELTPPPEPQIDPEIVQKLRKTETTRLAEKKRQRQAAALRAAAARKKASAAKADLAKKITHKPSSISQPRPSYPSSARRAGHEGTVMVSFTVGTNGRVSAIRVTNSSGHQSLDSAAVSTISKWQFKPARNGLGEATHYKYSIPVPFRLK